MASLSLAFLKIRSNCRSACRCLRNRERIKLREAGQGDPLRTYSDPKDLYQDSISSFDNNLLREKSTVLREADWSM